jgi:hypothetical protein
MNLINPYHSLQLFKLTDTHPPEPHWTDHYESQLSCTRNEPYCWSMAQCSSGYRSGPITTLYASVMNEVANNED